MFTIASPPLGSRLCTKTRASLSVASHSSVFCASSLRKPLWAGKFFFRTKPGTFTIAGSMIRALFFWRSRLLSKNCFALIPANPGLLPKIGRTPTYSPSRNPRICASSPLTARSNNARPPPFCCTKEKRSWKFGKRSLEKSPLCFRIQEFRHSETAKALATLIKNVAAQKIGQLNQISHFAQLCGIVFRSTVVHELPARIAPHAAARAAPIFRLHSADGNRRTVYRERCQPIVSTFARLQTPLYPEPFRRGAIRFIFIPLQTPRSTTPFF